MKKFLIASLAAVLALSAGAAWAKNELVILTQEDLFNDAQIVFEGNFNSLQILQEHTGGAGANVISATITGDGNGGPVGSAFTGAALGASLEPGTLTQQGFDNSMVINVVGTDNLFAFAQNGSGNRLSASINGMNNQAAVLQVGLNNHASFSQNGIGNTVNIVQRSW